MRGYQPAPRRFKRTGLPRLPHRTAKGPARPRAHPAARPSTHRKSHTVASDGLHERGGAPARALRHSHLVQAVSTDKSRASAVQRSPARCALHIAAYQQKGTCVTACPPSPPSARGTMSIPAILSKVRSGIPRKWHNCRKAFNTSRTSTLAATLSGMGNPISRITPRSKP